MKKVVILGSTGSLGKQTLEVLKSHPKDFKVIGLSAHKNKELLSEQARLYKVSQTATTAPEILKLATHPEADIIVNVISGLAGLEPTKAALKAGKTLLSGNKESIIAGKIIAPVIPLDSEHNAIFEIFKSQPEKTPRKIILPASGGPFLHTKDLSTVTLKQALKHPKWKMGAKISIESATLLNKGFEVLEAYYLFNFPLEKIQAKIHPECQIHGMVEFTNGETYAYFGKPDMKEHLENALLHTIGKSTNPEIRKINPEDYDLQEIPSHLPGIDLVLAAHKADRITEFLKKEEQIIQRFLNEEITFLQVFQELS